MKAKAKMSAAERNAIWYGALAAVAFYSGNAIAAHRYRIMATTAHLEWARVAPRI